MNPSSESFLYGAVRQNDLKRAERLLHEGRADPNKMSKILVHACAEGYLEMVKLLITNPFNPANVNLDSEWVYHGVPCITRPIWVAIKSNDLKLLQLLLWKASVKVDLECTNTFLAKSKRFTFECTPLWQAVVSEQESMVNELIKAGANVNAACTIIWSNGPLARHTTTDFLITMAVNKKDIDLCRRLVQHSCDLSARKTRPKGGFTALDVAILMDLPEIFDFLLQHIPAVNANILASAMFTAISSDRDPKYIEALIQHGGYKLGKHWRPAAAMSAEFLQGDNAWIANSDELTYGIACKAEDCCVTLLQCGFKIDTFADHFSWAVKEGMVRLMFQMVRRNPRVLQQSWLNNPEEFGDLPQHAVNWLHQVRRQPALLKGICEARLLRTLKPSPTNIMAVASSVFIQIMGIPLRKLLVGVGSFLVTLLFLILR